MRHFIDINKKVLTMNEKQKSENADGESRQIEPIVRLPLRIWNGVKIGWWAIMNPEPLTMNMFQMLSDLLQLILKVSFEDKHYMTEIVITNHDTKAKQPIVHIWAGAGVNATPHKRIRELIKENAALKERLRSS